jgi:hypothetical protein
MKNFLAMGAALAVSAAALVALPAQAATFTSYLEYKDDGGVKKEGPFGLVTLNELSATQVQVTVTLFDPEVGFVNTGNADPSKSTHDPFVFNLNGNYTVAVQDSAGQTFFNGGYSNPAVFNETPFGNFTNKIGCCVAPGNEKTGAKYQSPPPLIFTVTNLSGISFAGAGYTTDANGKVTTLGTGAHFLSNTNGWWFGADLVDKNGNTFNVAAKDAFGPCSGAACIRPPVVPEPATWALMIAGFGGAGAMLRRRRAALA